MLASRTTTQNRIAGLLDEQMITIVDYGVCNVGSLANMFKRIRVPCQITSDPDIVQKAKKIILPGVGSFDAGMARLKESGLAEAIRHATLEAQTPLLGICLGMQLLGSSSEEGTLPGLNLIEVTSTKLTPQKNAPIPHMGWNAVVPNRPHSLFAGLEEKNRFYFVHSYRIRCEDQTHELAQTNYGDRFTSSIAKGHIMAVQFHPEKSHRFGMRMLSNFAELKFETP